MENINIILVQAMKLENEEFKILVESLIARMPGGWKKENIK